MDSLKYKTIEEVFTHNFEPLHLWRDFLSVPHRLPGAVRYFLARQLEDPESASRLFVEEPERRNAGALAFADGSVLVLPDEIFQGADAYTQVAFDGWPLARLERIECEIEALAGRTRAGDIFLKADEIVESLGDVLGSNDSEILQARALDLAWDLNRELANAFYGGGCRAQLARAWLRIANRARELGFELQLFPEATAALL
jgi:hypothetical protein